VIFIMATDHVRHRARPINQFSSLSRIANRLQAREIIDRLCKDVVDHPDTWRERAIESIATALDVVERRQ
jgi:hypothetical protein